MSTAPPPVLTKSDLDHFYEKGFVHIEAGFDPELARSWSSQCWDRLGIDPEDESTWTMDRVHMGGSLHWDISEFAPKVYSAVCQLCGHDRVQHPVQWSDHFIVNLREGADSEWVPPSPAAKGWHKDGDFFRHFLDSPEQGLLVFVLWTDVVHHGGPTYVATDSIPVMARYLNEHREGVLPNGFEFQERIKECREFVEATGKAGDVYLLHPFSLHAVSQNILKKARIITNPPVSLKEPMNFNRPDGDYSPVERVILNALGVDKLDFRPEGPREQIVPERVKRQQELEAKLAAQKLNS